MGGNGSKPKPAAKGNIAPSKKQDSTHETPTASSEKEDSTHGLQEITPELIEKMLKEDELYLWKVYNIDSFTGGHALKLFSTLYDYAKQIMSLKGKLPATRESNGSTARKAEQDMLSVSILFEIDKVVCQINEALQEHPALPIPPNLKSLANISLLGKWRASWMTEDKTLHDGVYEIKVLAMDKIDRNLKTMVNLVNDDTRRDARADDIIRNLKNITDKAESRNKKEEIARKHKADYEARKKKEEEEARKKKEEELNKKSYEKDPEDAARRDYEDIVGSRYTFRCKNCQKIIV